MNEVIDAKFFEGQHCCCKIRSEDLGIVVLDEFFFEGFFSVESKAFSWFGSTSSTSPLLSTRPADWGNEQALHPHAGIEDFLLREPRVNHIHNTVDGYTSLGYVSGYDDLSPLLAQLIGTRGCLEDALLLMGREGAVEGNNCSWANLVA